MGGFGYHRGRILKCVFKDQAKIRRANDKTFQYATFGDATRREETALTALWEELNVAEAVNALFTEPRPLRRRPLQ